MCQQVDEKMKEAPVADTAPASREDAASRSCITCFPEWSENHMDKRGKLNTSTNIQNSTYGHTNNRNTSNGNIIPGLYTVPLSLCRSAVLGALSDLLSGPELSRCTGPTGDCF